MNQQEAIKEFKTWMDIMQKQVSQTSKSLFVKSIYYEIYKIILKKIEKDWNKTFEYLQEHRKPGKNDYMVGPAVLKEVYNKCYQKMWSLNKKMK